MSIKQEMRTSGMWPRCLVGGLLAVGVVPHLAWGKTITIAKIDDPAPGAPEGAVFRGFGFPLVNNAGQVAFEASLTGTGVGTTNDFGIWRDTTLIARAGDPAHGIDGGANFSTFNFLVLNDAGQVAYRASLTGTGVDGTNDDGIWRDTTLIARAGDPAHGIGGGVHFSGLFTPVFNDAGQVAYQASLTGAGVDTTNDFGIWRDTTPIARAGNPAYGIGRGANFSTFNFLVLNDPGQVAYRASLTGAGVDTTNDFGIWRDTTLIARAGDPAHGIGGGANFSTFNNPVLNDPGQVAYEASLTGAGVDTTNDFGIWRDTTPIARAGDPAHGIGGGTNFSTFNFLVLNNTGQVAYEASLTGAGVDTTNDFGIWRDTTLIAREGDPAHGIGGGVNFRGFNNPVLNDTGQVAYRAFLTGTGVDTTNDSGVWITGPNGQSLLVARKGDDLAGRTISNLALRVGSGGSDGKPRSFNNASQVAYHATFTNGDQGIFLYTPDLRWIGPDSGHWDDSGADSNWTIGQAPAHVHDVSIDPDTDLTVTAPTAFTPVKSLTVGGGSGKVTLRFGLDGSDVGAGDSRISALEALSLDGTLDLAMAAGFTPAYGDTFDILGYATRDGAFAQVNGAILSPELALGQFYNDTNGVLRLLATAPGDANGDLVVDIADFGMLAGNFNQPGTWETGDFDGDGITNINDFGLLAANFNGDFNDLAAAAESLGITIPEPTTAVVIGTLSGLLWLRRRRAAS